jgi:sulfatase modifying factor 1
MQIIFIILILAISYTQSNDTAVSQYSRQNHSLVKQNIINDTKRNLNSLNSKHIINIIENMVSVQGGTYTMGCNSEQHKGCRDQEKPAHIVSVSSFKISKYEITQAQWRAIVGTNPSYNKGCDICPVENVNWNDIKYFLLELNKQTGKRLRLPTEAEWEFAAKGGNKSLGYFYSGSNYIQNVAWYGDENSKLRTQFVGKLESNELGLYDMTGNVREWCSDWYSENYYRSSPRNNPRGPGSGLFRVVRGGSMYHGFFGYKVTSRLWENPVNRSRFIGFRLVEN